MWHPVRYTTLPICPRVPAAAAAPAALLRRGVPAASAGHRLPHQRRERIRVEHLLRWRLLLLRRGAILLLLVLLRLPILLLRLGVLLPEAILLLLLWRVLWRASAILRCGAIPWPTLGWTHAWLSVRRCAAVLLLRRRLRVDWLLWRTILLLLRHILLLLAVRLRGRRALLVAACKADACIS